MKNLSLNQLPTPQSRYSSYRELCNFLQLPTLNGASKRAQLKELNRYFSYHREGNSYIIDEVYPTPHSIVETRGKNKPLTEYQYLFNTILLYDLVFGARDNKEKIEGEGNNCISYTNTELRQKLFKLMNRDYYKVRKDSSGAAKEIGITEGTLKFADAKYTDKINGLSFRGFGQLKEECKIDVSNGIYIYYISVGDYLGRGEKVVKCRLATQDERSLIAAADWIGYQEYRKDYEDLEFEDKIDPETFRGRGKKLLKKKLKILNGAENIELIENEIFKSYADLGEKRDGLGDLTEEEFNEFMEEAAKSGKNGERNESLRFNFNPTKELLELMKKRDGLNRYALEKGEFWVNIVEKVQFFLPPKFTLVGILMERLGTIATMPEAQEKLNRYVLEWGNEAAEKRWNSFAQKFLIESKTGSTDIPGDVKKFGDRYIDIQKVENSYAWKVYKDETGKEWKVRFASNKMSFDEDNLRTYELQRDDGKEVVLWSAPHKEEVCTNSGELVEMARRIWSERKWMPIEGYLGSIWDEEEGREIGCVILNLGEVGILVLKREWNTRK